MNSRYLTFEERLEWAPEPVAETGLTDLLETCIFRCDDFAHLLRDNPAACHLCEVLAECVVACGQFMAALSRGSFLEANYALLCADVCTAGAALCVTVEGDAARNCRAACEACLAPIRATYGSVLAN